MAVPAYATDLTSIIEDMPSSTGWTLISSGGGGASSFSVPETDDFIQGSNCISRNPWTAVSIRGMVYNAATTIASGDAIFIWWKSDVAQALDTRANGGIQALVGNATTALKCYYVAGSDDYARGGWRCSPIDPTTTQSADIGTPSSVTDYFGMRWSVPVSGPSKGFPYKIDAIRHGSFIEVTAGDSGTPATFESLATHADDIVRRWGIVQPTSTGLAQQGTVNWGTASTAVYSRVSNKTLVLLDTLGFTATNFTQIIFNNASSDVIWDNVSIGTLDLTLNRGIISVNNNAVVSLINCNISDINTITDGGTNSTWDGTTWRRCNAVTAAGGSFLNTSILSSTVAADASSFIYNIATDPDGIMDGMSFSKGTNAHHAIEFGTSTPLTITLRGISFGTTFNSANENNDSTLYFADTGSDITRTINLVGCSGNISYKKGRAGDTINLVINPVTLTITVLDSDGGSPISGARVYVPVTSGINWPYLTPVTITGTGTTATVTHTAHGLTTNDNVVIKGANEDVYNGVYPITVTGTNSYTYTANETIGSSPATGTITSTFVLINGTTNGSGVISDSRTYSNNQPIGGWARKSTSSPFYRQGPIVDTVDSVSGKSITIQLISDE